MKRLPESPTGKNPPEQFTGDVWVDAIAAPQEPGQRMVVARVRFAPGEEHWHGAAPDRFMEHLAMLENGDDPATTTTWLEHVTDEQYEHATED